MQYTTDTIPLKRDYYYIIAFRDFLRITLYAVYFINKQAAKKALDKYITRKYRHQVISGALLRKYSLTYTINLGILPRYSKYDYEPGKGTPKHQRTMIRRRLRRMNMLTLVKPKYHIKQKVKYSVLIKNKQKVSTSKSSQARAFRLQRKPNFRYVILEKSKTHVRGILFKIKVIRIDTKTKDYDVKVINVRNNDLVIPYLITEILEWVKDNKKTYEKILKYITKRNLQLHQATQKRIQSGGIQEMGK